MSQPQTFAPSVRPVLLNVNDAAQALSISRSLLYELLAANKLRSVKVGRRRLIDVDSMKELHRALTANEGLKTTEQADAIGGAR